MANWVNLVFEKYMEATEKSIFYPNTFLGVRAESR